MSNITVTGNEAQFNEKVTFLKDVEIRGTLSVPTITGQATFLDRVNFAKDITFPEIEIKNKLTVGAGGTLFIADTSNGDGRIGIGSTNPTELLDVFGRAKIIDLDLENLNVSGISTFVGITRQQSVFFGNQLSISGFSTFFDQVRINSGDLILDGPVDDPKNIIFRHNIDNGAVISYESVGVGSTSLIIIKGESPDHKLFVGDVINKNVKLYANDETKLETVGTGVTILGDLIVPDVGIRTSRVGLGTTNPVGLHTVNDLGNGTLRLTIDGSISISRNIYDSAGSPGFNGYFLQRDGNGIRWSAFEPEETQGIRIQDEGVFIPTVGTAKTYSIVNFASINSFGRGTDNIRPEDGVGAGLATVFTFDLWGFVNRNVADSPIYRMTNVGIGTTNPEVSFQVNSNGSSVVAITSAGNMGIGVINPPHKLRVVDTTQLDTLEVLNNAFFREDVLFDGDNADIFFDSSEDSLEFQSNAKAAFGAAGSPPSLQIYYDGTSNIIEALQDKETHIKSDSEIKIQRQSNNDLMIHAKPLGSVDLYHGMSAAGSPEKKLETTNVGINVIGETETDKLNVTETSLLVGITTQQSTFFGNQLNISGISTFENNIDANANLDVDGHTELDDLNVSGVSTFVGIVTHNNLTFTNQIRNTGIITSNIIHLTGGSFTAPADGGDTRTDTAIVVNENFGIYSLELQTGAGNNNKFLRRIIEKEDNILTIGQDNTSLYAAINIRPGNAGTVSIGHSGAVSLVGVSQDGNTSNIEKLRTVGSGITVFGNTESQTLIISGISTFVGITTQQSTLFATQLSVSGISTFIGITTQKSTFFGNQLNITGLSTFNNDVQFTGDNYNVLWDKSKDAFDFDGGKAIFGATDGLEIYHNGNSYIKNLVGDLFIQQEDNTKDIKIQGASGTESILVDGGGNNSVTLYSSGNPKLTTNSSGIEVTGLTDTDTLNVSETSTFVGFATFNNEINVAGFSTFGKNVDINASVDISNDLDVGQNLTVGQDLDVDGLSELDDLNVAGISSFVGISTFKDEVGIAKTLDLGSHIRDVNQNIGVGVGKTDYRLSSVGTGVSWRPSGVQTKRTIWVSKNGDDNNSGLLEGDAKATIGGAAAIAVETDTIKIRPGVYVENNPIGLRTDVSVTGEDLRLVIIQTLNPFKDVFHVRRGCLVENLNFGGSNVGVSHDGAACVAFPPPAGPESAVSGYTAPGPATEGPSGRWRSPYVRNCTNFMTGSIGMKIDGDNATASTKGANLKSMVCDSFTQYNEAGIGVSLTNDAYAQLVSIFTINTDIGIFAGTGAQCDLTNSNSSFGNFGLVAVGLGSTQFTGIVSNTNPANELISSTNAENQDVVVCANVKDDSDGNTTPPFTGEVRRPFDGQALYFKIDLDNYPDAQGSGRISAPLQQLKSVNIIEGADVSGYSAIDPPNVLIRDNDNTVEPKGPQGIIAEATATVSPTGNITAINVVAQGRNYLPTQNIVVDIEGDTGIATAVMTPIYFTVEEATITEPVSGITSITFNEFIPYELFPDDPFSLQRISRILTSSHSFEYVGTGTDINIATPLQGAIPIKENEIVAKDGAQIPFTSTDQKGNFDIGEGLQINQTTSTISGRDFSRSIQAEVTPLILALR